VLGVLPLFFKKIIEILNFFRKLSKFPKPKAFQYNIVVIGAGSAGLVSSYLAAALKAKVALIEANKMGGDCLNTGCVPSKTIIKRAKIVNYLKNSHKWGLSFKEKGVIDKEKTFQRVLHQVNEAISTIEPHDSKERYQSLGVDVFFGKAELKSPFEVVVKRSENKEKEITLTTKNIIIASGAAPFVPEVEGIKDVPYFTSDTVWSIKQLPKKFLVVGGGPIGCELAQTFSRLGSEVTIVTRGAQLIPREDKDAADVLEKVFKEEGIEVLTSCELKGFKKEEEKYIALCKLKDKEKVLEISFSAVLIALGRRANIAGLGLENVGVEVSPRGTIAVDEYLRTSVPNIYACGDVAGPYQFTHFGAYQAWFAVSNALFSPLKQGKPNYSVIPWCTYTDPQVARVGYSEKELKEQGIKYEVAKYPLNELDRAITEGETEGFVKVVTKEGSPKILGVTIVAAEAGEMLSEFSLAMTKKLTLRSILSTVHPYPTWSEANKYAAGVWQKAHTPSWALKLLEKFNKWRLS
ncbi:MAG: pyridine nucleotide-disulfide oxidoreductase, partial [Candidatus Dadabacteria bacterium]